MKTIALALALAFGVGGAGSLALGVAPAVAQPAASPTPGPTVAAPFVVSSSRFTDGGPLPAAFAASPTAPDGAPCGGQNVSPPLAWRDAPAGTASYAVVMFDVDAAAGNGFTHWIAYEIPPTKTSFAEGEASGATGGGTSAFAFGKNGAGATGYRGMCPPRIDAPHHYVFTVFALDLSVGSLAPGLTRDELFAAIRGHVLRVTSIVGRFGRS